MTNGITDNVKANLLWAFSDTGTLDLDIFFTILEHEGYEWNDFEPHYLARIVVELSLQCLAISVFRFAATKHSRIAFCNN